VDWDFWFGLVFWFFGRICDDGVVGVTTRETNGSAGRRAARINFFS
jgi:hypothetical protein